MMINNYNNISFGQKVPTSSLLKIGAGIYDFNDAKALSILSDDRFPGHVGYYKKAQNFVRNIAEKNEDINSLIESINSLNSKNDKLSVIRKTVIQLGKEVDVVI